MRAEPRLTSKPQIDELDEVVRRWSAARSATSIAAAPPGGFNLESPLRGLFDHYEAATRRTAGWPPRGAYGTDALRPEAGRVRDDWLAEVDEPVALAFATATHNGYPSGEMDA